MITAVTGRLVRVDEDRLQLACGPVQLEVLLPAADVADMADRVGEEVTLHTAFYLEGEASGGNMTPRLIGFRSESDRGFFNTFITVKGIGPRKALRALAVPASEIAAAIESHDARLLVKLPQIGKRAAETIIAELAGKVGRFVESGIDVSPRARPAAAERLTEAEDDAVATLVALGERRADAIALLDRVRQQESPPATGDALVREMLRLRGGPR